MMEVATNMKQPGVVCRLALAAMVIVAGAGVSSQERESAVIELGVGESSPLGSSDLTITLEKIERDSRCPVGVTCVWEGDATARFSVGASGGARTTIDLHTNPKFARQAEHAGFVIRLDKLQPYPTAERTIEPSEYRATLEVGRSKS